jgi:hypothetical protein
MGEFPMARYTPAGDDLAAHLRAEFDSRQKISAAI